MIRRASIVVAVALAMLGLFALDRGTGGGARLETAVAHPSLPASGHASTWYCPAVGAAGSTTLTHVVIVTNPDRKVLHARVTGFKAAPGTAIKAIEVAPLSQVEVPSLGPDVTGVVVELLDGRGTVAHRLSGTNAEDTGRCTDTPARSWYFPSANTELGSSATLWLLNPFPTDASLDISVATPDGVRVPQNFGGLVIPGGTSRRIELADSVQRRPQFAFSVVATSGQIVAELAQISDAEGGLRGLRLQLGVSNPGRRWLLADGFGGAASSEQLVVYNTVGAQVHVSVAVIPAGVDVSALPEPFEIDVPSHRFAVIDLNAETRLDDQGLRSFRVEAGSDVVVERVVSMRGEGGDGSARTRPQVRSGLASSTGSAVTAHEWLLDGVDPKTESPLSVAMISNPSPSAIAVVQLFAIIGGSRIEIGQSQEVQAGTTLAFDLTGAFPTAAGSVLVESHSPIVVEGRTTAATHRDLSVIEAVPGAGIAPLASTGGGS